MEVTWLAEKLTNVFLPSMLGAPSLLNLLITLASIWRCLPLLIGSPNLWLKFCWKHQSRLMVVDVKSMLHVVEAATAQSRDVEISLLPLSASDAQRVG